MRYAVSARVAVSWLRTRDGAGRRMAGEDVFDITIIGAGPTGLFAAFYAGLREMRTKIIEALPEPGGQLAVLYPES